MSLRCLLTGHQLAFNRSAVEELTLPSGEPNRWARKYHQVLRCCNCGHETTAWDIETWEGGMWSRCDLRRVDEILDN